jgi:chromosome segregation ATPase
MAQNKENEVTAKANRQTLEEAKRELAAFDTQEGQQMSKLEKVSKDTARAWKWVQENLESFEKEVYGPPMITCSITDPRYVDAVESLLRRNDFLTITAQTLNDMKKLSDQFHGVMGLGDITVRQVEEKESHSNDQKPLSQQDFQRAGMEGWAIDYIDGPTPVLDMLCGSGALNQCPIGLREPSDNQYKVLAENVYLRRFVTGTHSYNISRRKEYGPQAVSTISKSLQRAQYWTDQPVDVSARREIQEKIDSLVADFEKLREHVLPLRQKIKDLKEQVDAVKEEIKSIKEEKAVLQREASAHKALPAKIRVEEELLEAKKNDGAENQDLVKKLRIQHDNAVLRKAKLSLDYKDQITKIRKCHEELVEAEIRLIEAESDVAGLKERNAGIVEQRDLEQEKVRTIEEEATRVKETARRALAVCKELLDDPANREILDQFSNPPEGSTVEQLQIEIASEESRLEYIHANNPNAIRDYERRQVEVDQLKEKILDTETKLEKIGRNITKIRSKWEPELDKLIAEISDAFSHNFEQIGCAGEVSVHKDDDFEQWAIQIKVKFR